MADFYPIPVQGRYEGCVEEIRTWLDKKDLDGDGKPRKKSRFIRTMQIVGPRRGESGICQYNVECSMKSMERFEGLPIKVPGIGGMIPEFWARVTGFGGDVYIKMECDNREMFPVPDETPATPPVKTATVGPKAVA